MDRKVKRTGTVNTFDDGYIGLLTKILNCSKVQIKDEYENKF